MYIFCICLCILHVEAKYFLWFNSLVRGSLRLAPINTMVHLPQEYNLPTSLPSLATSPSPLKVVADPCLLYYFLYIIGIVHHFDTVNNLDTVKTMHNYASLCH